MDTVKIDNLYKTFGELCAVDNINLTIKEGEIYGLLGPNGAGKSTTINILCGLLKKSKGEMKVLEKDIESNANFVKKNIGLVPQDLAIYEDLTAYENVRFFASLYGLTGKELKERTMEALEFVGLADRKKDYPRNYSGGMKRRLNIACAIAHKPKLIIMDEPTVGIDPQSRNHILNSVKKLNEKGCTIIYTSHYMEEVENICTRIGIIDHGKLIAEGTKEELSTIITDKNALSVTVNNIEDVNVKKLKDIDGVSDININEGSIIVYSDKKANNLDKLILFFTENRVEIKNIFTKQPDLESVFLALTGRKLRD